MSTFTARPEAAIDRDVQRDLDRVLQAVHATGLPVRAVYLTGAFGRGEGTVRHDGERWRGVNDYDLVVVTDEAERSAHPGLDGLGPRLADELGIDYVDLWLVTPGELAAMRAPTIQTHDLKHASRLLQGEDVLDALPSIDPDRIPPYEFARLLANRAAGLLTARLPEHASPRYAAIQLVKACIAAGDAAVYLGVGYHHSYRERLDRFAGLARAGGLPIDFDAVQVDAIARAFREKILGPSPTAFHVPGDVMKDVMSRAFHAVAERATGRRLRSLADAASALVSEFPGRPHEVLFAQPVFYCSDAGRLGQAAAYLSRFLRIPGALRLPWTRVSAARVWERWCHQGAAS